IGHSAVGPDGNLYVTGAYKNSIPALGLSEDLGSEEAFVAKYNPYGDLIYAFRIGTANEDYGRKILFDKYGNFYVLASFKGTEMTLTGATGPVVDGINLPYSDMDLVIAKYNSQGAYLWHRFLASGGDDGGSYPNENLVAATSTDDGIVVSCFSKGSNLDLASLSLSTGGEQTVLFKLHHDGTEQWLTSMRGNGVGQQAIITDLTYDGTNVFAIGQFKGTSLEFKTAGGIVSPGHTLVNTVSNRTDGFIAKFQGSDTGNGGILESSQIASTSDIAVGGITYLGGNIYYAASSNTTTTLRGGNTVNTSSTDTDLFLVSANATSLMTNTIRSYEGQPDWDIAVDLSSASGQINLLANTNEAFVSGVGTVSASSFGTPFIITYDPGLNENYVTQAENFGYATGVAIGDDFKNIYITGEYSGAMSYPPHDLPFGNISNPDLMIARLNCSPVVGISYATLGGVCGGIPDTLINTGYYGELQWEYEVTTSPGIWNSYAGGTTDTILVFDTGQDRNFRLRVSPDPATPCAGDPDVISNEVFVGRYDPISNNSISNPGGVYTYCIGSDPDPLTGTVPTQGNGSYDYEWISSTDGGSSWSTVGSAQDLTVVPTINEDILYRRVVTSAVCRDSSNLQNLNTHPPIAINIGNYTLIDLGDSVLLNAEGGGTYQWSPITYLDDHNLANPTATPTESILYTVEVTQAGTGCIQSASQRISIKGQCPFTYADWNPPTGLSTIDATVDMDDHLAPIDYTYASAVTVDIGVGNQNEALGAPDNNTARLNSSGDILVVDLQDTIPAGAPYELFWRMRNDLSVTGPVSPIMQESLDNVTYYPVSYEPSTSSTTIVVDTLYAENATRYLYFELQDPNGDFRIDAIRFMKSGGAIGGSWVGSAVSPDGLFDPSIGVGDYEIGYVLSEPCIDTMYRTLSVAEPSCDGIITYPTTIYYNERELYVMTNSNPGGTFYDPSGTLVIDPATGTIDLNGTTPGTYDVVYDLGVCADTVEMMVLSRRFCTALPEDTIMNTAPGQCESAAYDYDLSWLTLTDSISIVQNQGLASGSTYPKDTTTNEFTVAMGAQVIPRLYFGWNDDAKTPLISDFGPDGYAYDSGEVNPGAGVNGGAMRAQPTSIPPNIRVAAD
ncbi:MAG: hypothetical protein HKO93_02475, partial [Flavobacteriales bacterium]|nr:hypothetical protein [Flavobacteriales bacterium]